MKHYEFSIPINPIAKARPRMTRKGFVYTPPKTRAYEKELKKWMMIHWAPFKKALTIPLMIQLAFFIKKSKSCKKEFHTKRPDIDNLIKAVMDAGNGIIWKDDAQIVGISANKYYAYHANSGEKIEGSISIRFWEAS